MNLTRLIHDNSHHVNVDIKIIICGCNTISFNDDVSTPIQVKIINIACMTTC